jgi:hypothetical protein
LDQEIDSIYKNKETGTFWVLTKSTKGKYIVARNGIHKILSPDELASDYEKLFA